ncbi:hypothetical protein LZ31DRAFT_325075 [Colletotrichum somersetense]|nr:hypothetical protein LZ31DRAFT_325075 [Colletotrichum somersetense]
MISTNLIRLAASAAIMAGVNGQVSTAITTIIVTAFTTVGFSNSSSSTADSSITTIPSTTPIEVIPITITTTITILLPDEDITSSSAAIMAAFASLNDGSYNDAVVTPVPTVSTHNYPSLVTTTICNFNRTCSAITVPAVIPLFSRVTTLTDCYDNVCRPVTTLTYPVLPDEVILTRCNFNGTCSVVTRNNALVTTSILLVSASSSRSVSVRRNTTTAVSSSIRTSTSTFSGTRGPTLVTRTSVNTTNRSSGRSVTLSTRPTSFSSRSAAPSSRFTTPSSPPLGISQQPNPSPPSATTRTVVTSPTAVAVAGEPVLTPFGAMPLVALLGAVAAGMAFM